MLSLQSRVLPLLAGLSLAVIPALHAQGASPSSPPLRGDVDGDGRVTRADAEALRAYLVGRPTLLEGHYEISVADVNGDGRVSAADAAIIARYAAGQDVSRFPVGQPVVRTPESADGGGSMTMLVECTVEVASGSVSCAAPRPTSRNHADLIIGKPYYALVSSGTVVSKGNPADEDSTSANVALQNLIGQPIGTTNGSTADSANRIFFYTGPTVTAVSSGTIASASIRIDNPYGTGNFTAADGTVWGTNRPFFRYASMLAPNAVSPAQTWRFVYSSNVTRFSYSVLVSAPVQYENGWITVTPAVDTLQVGQTATLSGTVRDASGAVVTDGITWSSSDTTIAKVNASTGQVTAVSPGTATITATSNANSRRRGTARVVSVAAAPTVSASTTQITTSDAVLTSGSITTVTVQAKDASGNNLTTGGSNVVLSTTQGTLGSVTDNGNGTYTADLTYGGTNGTVTVTGTIDGAAITDDAQITFQAGGIQRTWTGLSGSNWTATGSWSPRGTPSASDTIVINAGGTQPQITDADKTILRLVMTSSGGTLNLGGFRLTITADAVASGGTVSNGTVEMSGSAAALAGTVPNLLVTGSILPNGSVTAKGTVTVSSGTLTISNQTFTISGS